MSIDFEKYVAKGVIGDLSVVALNTSGANWKMKSGIPSPGHLESKTVQSAIIMRMSTLCWYLVQRRDLVQGYKKQCVKSWYNRPRGPPTQPWAANRPRAAASTRPPVTLFATSQDRAASRTTKFVCVGCRTKHLDQLESTNILVLRGILWCPFLRGKCAINLRGFLSFWDYFFWVHLVQGVAYSSAFGWRSWNPSCRPKSFKII